MKNHNLTSAYLCSQPKDTTLYGFAPHSVQKKTGITSISFDDFQKQSCTLIRQWNEPEQEKKTFYHQAVFTKPTQRISPPQWIFNNPVNN